jgi:hypothetical protein
MRVAGLTVEVNKMVEPAHTLMLPLTATGIVEKVALWENAVPIKNNRNKRLSRLFFMLRMQVRR